MRKGPLALLLAACMAAPAAAEIRDARFTQDTTRYAHGVLGDAIEYGALELTLADGSRRLIQLPDTRVFEDLAPRLTDLDGDGTPEVIAVESDHRQGARLSIYGPDGLIAATPFIGRAFRWLAPVGAADFDGDGHVELAYIDRPHLAKRLTLWRFRDGALAPVATKDGLTNHRIGDDFISGGIRDCGDGPEMITANADWTGLLATRLTDGQLHSLPIAANTQPNTIAQALACAL